MKEHDADDDAARSMMNDDDTNVAGSDWERKLSHASGGGRGDGRRETSCRYR